MWTDNVNARFVLEQYVTVQAHANILDKFCKELAECYGDSDRFSTRCLELREQATEAIESLARELNAVIERERE